MRVSVALLAALALAAARPGARPGKGSFGKTGGRARQDEWQPRWAASPAGTPSLEAQPTWGTVFSVLDYGAVPDGKTDNTVAFASALSAAGQAGGGVVWVPAGRFAFDGTLVVPTSVVLKGVASSPSAHNAGQGKSGVQPTTGSVLMPRASRGNLTGTPFVTLTDNAAVQGVLFFYPDQVQDAPPQPYPWTVDMVGEDTAVMDSELLNSYNGIRAVGAARHYIARVYGQPTNTGIFIDKTYDIGRVENVHFNPWYSTDHSYLQHQLTYGQAFVVARSDWEYFLNTFVFGMAVGYRFVESSTGSCNGNFVGIGADMCPNASVLVEAADPWGILIANGEFTSFIDKNFGNSSGLQTQVVVTPSNKGAVRFVNSAFWGPSTQIANIQGTGSVGFTSCLFNAWADKADAAISVASGDLIVTACEFQQAGGQVALGKDVKRAVISSNLFTGAANITNLATGDVQIGLNAQG